MMHNAILDCLFVDRLIFCVPTLKKYADMVFLFLYYYYTVCKGHVFKVCLYGCMYQPVNICLGFGVVFHVGGDLATGMRMRRPNINAFICI